MLHDLVKAIQNAVAALLRALTIFAVGAETMFANFVTNGIKGAIIAWSPIVNALEGQITPIVATVVDAMEKQGPGLAKAVRVPFSSVVLQFFRDSGTALRTRKAHLNASTRRDAMGDAFGAGIASHTVAMAFEAIFPEKLNSFDAIAPILSEMAGYGEVAKAIREPLYENAFGQALKYYYKSQFKPEFADEGDAVQWRSRRLLSEADLRGVFKYSGLKAKYEGACEQRLSRDSAARPGLANSGRGFSDRRHDRALQFAGIRDQDIARLLPLLEENSVRTFAVSISRRYSRRRIRSDRRSDARQSPGFAKLLDQGQELRPPDRGGEAPRTLRAVPQISDALYETNQLDDSQYVPALQAIGINDADANAHFAIDSARKKGRELLKEERDLARQQGRQTALAVQTARTEYLSGSLDDVAFSAAITTSGLPADLIPGTIALGVAQKSARRVEKYGLLLDRDKAQILTEKVAALKEQVVKKLTPIDAASQTLDSFGIPPANRNALLSDWSAQALKTVLPV
jgi:hypothetical protein